MQVIVRSNIIPHAFLPLTLKRNIDWCRQVRTRGFSTVKFNENTVNVQIFPESAFSETPILFYFASSIMEKPVISQALRELVANPHTSSYRFLASLAARVVQEVPE